MDPHPTPGRGQDGGRLRSVPRLFHQRVPVLLSLGIAVLLIVVFGALSLRMISRRSHEVDSVRARLSSMTQVRQERLAGWLQSCHEDANLVGRFPTIRELVGALDTGTRNERSLLLIPDLVEHARIILDMVVETRGYEAILIVGADGEILASSTRPPPIDIDLIRRTLESAGSGTPFVDNHRSADTPPQLVFAAPVNPGSAQPSGEENPLGFLLFVVDPVAAVYPLMANRVLLGDTDDLVLASPDDRRLLVLTPPRFDMPEAGTTSFLVPPIPRPDTDRGEAFFLATDYRGVPVYASIRTVDGTPWVVVGKMDAAEAMQRVTGEWNWLLMTALATLLAVAILFVALSRHYRARHFQAVADQEARYRALAENARDIILIVDIDGCIVEANRAAAKAYGIRIEDLVGRNVDTLRADGTKPGPSERILEAAAGDIFFETEHRRKDGTTFPVEVSARGIRLGHQTLVVAIIRDITERKRLEKQSVIAQRMEALGQLAGGVAHDFNNLLTAIRGYAVLVQESMDLPDPRRAELEEVVKASDRAANLTQQLLAFSRRQATERRVVDLNAIVQGLEGMLPRLIGENIRFRTELEERPLWIRADASQIENLLVNLVVNASDAMPQGGGLTLVTRSVMLPEGSLDAREHARLEVLDTGSGMNDEVRARAFEPFFTTKEPGRGTGLGLSTCYGIVQQHDGTIALDSAIGRGTTVRIDIPSAVRTLTDELPVLTMGPAPHGQESILLAEDDPGVRAYTGQVLRSLGYTVLQAAGGHEALEIVRSRPDVTLDLLVTDVVMPGMSGVDLRNHLRRLRPGLRTLFVSGYAESAMFDMGGVERGAPVLRKPFSPAELGRKVRDVLDRRPRTR